MGRLVRLDGSRCCLLTGVDRSGYIAPQNLANYAMYLDSRVRTYKELKHDAIRVQSESNRDRLSTADDESPVPGRPVQRSKTVMGRKLRVMTVDKGLLRETKMVQRLTDALLECKVCGLDLCSVFREADWLC
jgi:hypothetical protein